MAAKHTTTVEVVDYYDGLHQAGWTRRTSGFMAGATVAGFFASVIGAAVAFLPYIFSAMGLAGAAEAVALPSLAAVGVSAAAFAGVGGLLGLAAVAALGADSGSLAAGLAEKEAREKVSKQHGVTSPGTEVKVKIKPRVLERPPIFNPKVPLFTMPLFAAFGAILALNPATAPGIAMLGLQAGTTAGVAAGATTFGLIGALPSFKFSYLTNACSNFYMKVITGQFYDQLFGTKPAEPIQQPLKVKEKELEVVSAVDEPATKKTFASKKLHFVLQELTQKTEECEKSVPLQRGPGY